MATPQAFIIFSHKFFTFYTTFSPSLADFSIHLEIPDETESLANELGSTVSRDLTLANRNHRLQAAPNAEGAAGLQAEVSISGSQSKKRRMHGI